MKKCECGNSMILIKIGYQYIWECEECQITKTVEDEDEIEIEEGEI